MVEGAGGPPTPLAGTFVEAHRLAYGRQVLSLLVGRAAIIVVSLVILLIYEQGSPKLFAGAHAVLIAALALAIVQLVVHRRGLVQDLERFVVVGVTLDVATTAVLAYLTGGILNPGLSVLFFATILSAALLISEWAGVVVATAATIAQAAVGGIYMWAASDPTFQPPFVPVELYADVPLRYGRLTANLIAVLIAYHGVARLASRSPYRLSIARILYDEVIERMREGLVVIDADGRIALVNMEACRLLNWARPSLLVGKRYEMVLRRREDRTVLDVLARGTDVHAELSLVIRDRPPVDVEVVTTVLRDAGGRVRGVIGVFRDLALKRRLEEAERRVARLAGTEEIAMGIAHEIRTPLASIRGAVQELAKNAFTDDADRRLAEIVRRESDRLDRILQQFLDYARMRPPEHAPLDLWRLTEETAILLARRPEAEGVEVTCRQDGPFTVLGDADQLRQAVMNIGKNALEAMSGAPLKEGQAKHRLRFVFQTIELATRRGKAPGGSERVLAAERGVELAIHNDGPAIAREDGERVFSPFFTTKRGGLGLGLAITQKVVRLHGGQVLCDEGDLGGACFRIQMPLHVPPPPGPEARAS